MSGGRLGIELLMDVSESGFVSCCFTDLYLLLRLVEIIDMKGAVYFIAALPRRDEVFNRLVAIGRQRWESC